MNGPDHFRAAEELIVDAREAFGVDADNEWAYLLMAEAQVHATLAAAAASAHAHMGSDARGNWNAVAR